MNAPRYDNADQAARYAREADDPLASEREEQRDARRLDAGAEDTRAERADYEVDYYEAPAIECDEPCREPGPCPCRPAWNADWTAPCPVPEHCTCKNAGLANTIRCPACRDYDERTPVVPAHDPGPEQGPNERWAAQRPPWAR